MPVKSTDSLKFLEEFRSDCSAGHADKSGKDRSLGRSREAAEFGSAAGVRDCVATSAVPTGLDLISHPTQR